MSKRRGARALPTVVGAVSLAPAAVAPLAIYLAVLTAAAGRARGEARRGGPSGPAPHIAVLIPAHDEETLIGDTVASLGRCDHPADRLTVHVVADHCTDRTAAVAEHAGATVHRHDDPHPRGKSAALRWALPRLDDGSRRPDVVLILDADSIVQPDFLTEIERPMRAGARAVQAYYGVRDASSSDHASLRDIALALRHLVRPLGRTYLGGSCGLFGNGMAFELDVLRARPWSDHLTEDLELQLRLLLEEDVVVEFAPGAVVLAQMPEDLSGARTQNERWERGRVELLRSYFPRLTRAAMTTPGRRRWRLVDACLDLAVPPLSVLVAATTASSALAGAAFAVHRGRATSSGVALGAVSCAALAFHVVGGLRVADMPMPDRRTVLAAPRLVLWKIGLWTSVLRRGRQVAWTRTARASV